MATRWMQNHIFGLDVCNSCCICEHSVENVEHVLSSCTPLASTMYLRRHNEVLKILYHYLIGSHTKDYWHDQTPVYETDLLKRDRPVQVVGYSQNDRPDIVWNKSDKHAYLFDVSIPRMISMIQKTALLGSCRIMRSVLLGD